MQKEISYERSSQKKYKIVVVDVDAEYNQFVKPITHSSGAVVNPFSLLENDFPGMASNGQSFILKNIGDS